MMKSLSFVSRFLFLSSLWSSIPGGNNNVIHAWQQCPMEAGGGICPDKATCCPSGSPGISGCISSKSKDPPDGHGQCCDAHTGCAYGYSCHVDPADGTSVCTLNPNPPDYLNAPQTPRYDMCRIPPDMATQVRQFQGFPIAAPQDEHRQYQPKNFTLGYYSSMGSITTVNAGTATSEEDPSKFASIETILVVIHGSGRNADDYLCAGISLIPEPPKQQRPQESVLVIAPKFAADVDHYERSLQPNLLYWADRGLDVPIGHTWRYGASAMNNRDVTSYDAMDKLMEYLVTSSNVFPNLRRIVLAGHSAGGQFVHRWTLLSSSPHIWNDERQQHQQQEQQHDIEIRAIVANPRSYCYLDGRRILFQETKQQFAVPNQSDVDLCPGYNQWQWGLDAGGDILSPYKDRALNTTSTRDIARRYASRHVVYLAGEYDTIEQQDRCETYHFQGINRNQRAKNYYRALTEFFSNLTDHIDDDDNDDNPGHVHELYVVSGSPHDHMLMFQSEAGREVVFGKNHQHTYSSSTTSSKDHSPGAVSPPTSDFLSSFYAKLKELMIDLSFSKIQRGTVIAAEATRLPNDDYY